MIKKIVPVLLLGMVMTLASHRAEAGLTYQAVPLGGLQWKYIYHVDGVFSAGDGFNLLYDFPKYASLAVTVPLNTTNWFQTTPVTDPSAAGPGIVNFIANVPISGVGGDFEVAFDWTVQGSPGSQTYELFDGNTLVAKSFQTTPTGAGVPVPEPGTMPLVLAGLLLILRNIQRRQLRFLSNSAHPTGSTGASFFHSSALRPTT